MGSSRLPGKLLLRNTGKSVLHHTYQSAMQSIYSTGMCVATDDEAIRKEVESFGGDVVMTGAAENGTERVALATSKIADHADADIIVDVQADEPEIKGSLIDLAVKLLKENPAEVMSTIASPIRSLSQLCNRSCVKVVLDHENRALYFSRGPVPYPGILDGGTEPDNSQFLRTIFYRHVGVYAYRRDFLLKLVQHPPCQMETMESLEQLRALYFGHKILVGIANEPTYGIDTKEDYMAFVIRMNRPF
jgi:3-deoxy-manno-octulosonate cytidylyltransferase (CMP-KDO synthetase)